MNHSQNFDKQNFDELLVGFIGKALREEDWRENLDSLAIHQIRQFSTVKLELRWYTDNNIY